MKKDIVTQEEIDTMRNILTMRDDLENNWEKVLAFRFVVYMEDGSFKWAEGADKNYWLYEQ